MDMELMLAKITEAYCVEKGIPVRRKFTDAELEDAKDLLILSVARLDQLDLEYDEYHPPHGPVTNHDLTEDQRLDSQVNGGGIIR